MRTVIFPGAIFKAIFLILVSTSAADQRQSIYALGLELERQASALAQESFDHFRGRNNTISDEEQAVLFNSEAFLASCRLFLRLTEERSDYYRAGFLRTNLYNAFLFLGRSFSGLEASMKRVGVLPYALSGCRRLLNRIESEFSRWPSADNLAYLDQKYVKARNDAVYLIERKGTGLFIRRAFKNLESLYRYNYDRNGGKDPWKFLVEVAETTLTKMEEGEPVDLTFEGRLVIEQSTRPNRSVYLIEDGKKRGVTSPRVLQRLGGWSRVYEVPAEIIVTYPDGEPIT
jgi:hypothetical protein